MEFRFDIESRRRHERKIHVAIVVLPADEIIARAKREVVRGIDLAADLGVPVRAVEPTARALLAALRA